MKIAVIGTGYVGLVAGTCFAETGNDVICVDIDTDKIRRLSAGEVPIYEPGLGEMVKRNLEEERLRFTTDLTSAVQASDIIFIAVGTPAGEDGSSDLRYVLVAARSIAKSMNGFKIIVNKSTVPVGTARRVRKEVAALTNHPFEVVSNPEFLKEGAAIDDFMKPDRVVVGTNNPEVADVMRELYGPFIRTGAPILVMDPLSSEMTKYAANAMLASRISFMNEIANICEHVGADVHWVRQGIGTDRRIGSSFLFSGIGYGGSCFPKDIRALISVAREHGCDSRLIQVIEEVNELQKRVLVEKVCRFFASDFARRLDELEWHPSDGSSPQESSLFQELAEMSNNRVLREVSLSARGGKGNPAGLLKGRTFGVWGLSFKPQTDDMREAPSQVIIDQLLEAGASIRAYDPESMKEAQRVFGDRIYYAQNTYDALKGADALILITEWLVFRNPDFGRIRSNLKYPVIFDGRNQYNPEEMRQQGFLYFGIGR